ncbi:tRNA (N(6)-L-threonylcarbamoyladenosine(37)-C(2))-methylthiotransferase MtaB [Carboxydochorda subterranea]|uniref:tRNA (N(6)-L-threonylcarbamoyladenosine(37)-C(2))-methylthiotransferase MtaB n=1 Tax=Carboxydichorda subterranea TaxID=3109565 RepID=A0ABZ1C0G0_9FIRM|nr:tRNA (N(6)-L-threonylcarbamoyladenosine(37)-C(2))-methylthiotransferase MtaB [Limnochorda sp. L945t]WRP18271.1 tRNA (N(6)-L-threonylcarbamoyladenosine(37)-C(2))-methylthiotransferase MtaB [Limnochorda sp. L945t]
MRVAFLTLGCKVNQYDTQAMAELFARQGWTVVDGEQRADVVVVNTCAVTGEGGRKSRRAIRRAVRQARPGTMVLVTGCLAQLESEQLAAIPGVRAVVGPDRRRRLVEIAMERSGRVAGDGPSPEVDVALEPRRGRRSWEELPVRSFVERSRAVVKVQDGCDEMCAFCVVPYVRGRSRSRPPEAVIDEVRTLAAAGYQEIVVSGIHLGAYGADGWDLTRLLEAIEEVPGSFRVRLSSLLPGSLTESLVRRWGDSRRLCPHLHLSLQSGDDEILERMGRRYRMAEVEERVEALRSSRPDLAVSADVIVGFPGESDRAAEATVEALRRLGVARVHAFPYSARPLTRAARLDGRVPPEVVRRRMQRVRAVAAELAVRYHRSLVGREVDVLVERSPSATIWAEGVDEHYVRVRLAGMAGNGVRPGRVVRAQVLEAGRMRVLASPVEPPPEGRNPQGNVEPA